MVNGQNSDAILDRDANVGVLCHGKLLVLKYPWHMCRS
jgi:hypothetical protein